MNLYDALSENDTKIIQLESEGGSGKSMLLFSLFKQLLDDIYAVPMLIPMINANDGVLSYIKNNYLPNASKNDGLASLLSELKNYKEYKFYFLLDGVNEASYDNVQMDLDELFLGAKKYENIKIVFSLRASTSFIVSSLKNIYVDIIKTFECLPIDNFIDILKKLNISVVNIEHNDYAGKTLSRPFYLRKYIELAIDKGDKGLQLDEFHLINEFMDFSISKVKNISNIDVVLENFIASCYDYRVKNKLSGIELSGISKTVLVDYLRILVPEDDKGTFKFVHENYLDFLFAKNIIDKINKREAAFDMMVEYNYESMRMISYGLFNCDFYSSVCFEDLNECFGLSIEKDLNKLENTFSNLGCIISVFLKGLVNGSEEKEAFSKRFESTAKKLIELTEAKIENDLLSATELTLELLLTLGDILRRANSYDDSIALFNWMKKNVAFKKYRLPIKHNLAKSYLYKGYIELITSGTSGSFKKGYRILKKVSKSGYVLSSNLLAMITAYPIPPLAISKRDPISAFNMNWESVKRNYYVTEEYLYPLTQCFRGLVSGDMELKSNSYMDTFELLLNKAVFVERGKGDIKTTQNAIECIFKHLSDNLYDKYAGYKFVVYSEYALYLLLNKNDIDMAKHYAGMSLSTVLSKLILALASEDENFDVISSINDDLMKRYEHRTVDALDCIYWQIDMNKIWTYFKWRNNYSEDYVYAVETLCTKDLISVSI